MKLTILGSGTAQPSSDRNSAGYVVEANGMKLLLDCGAGTLHALAKYEIQWQRLTHIFVSHFHVDHVGELASLLFAFRYALTEDRHESLTLIAHQGIERVLTGLKVAFGEKIFNLKFPFRVMAVEPKKSLTINNQIRLEFAKTPHTDESLAIRITENQQSISYTGDTGFSPDLIRFFGQTDVLISECSFEESDAKGRHLSIDEVARLAQAAKVKRLIATHFYFSMGDEALINQLRREYSGEIFVGKDGLQIEI
jgi:ribonuclease BN (tRNA processing enzyme)